MARNNICDKKELLPVARKSFCGDKKDNLWLEITSVTRKIFCVNRKENFCGKK